MKDPRVGGSDRLRKRGGRQGRKEEEYRPHAIEQWARHGRRRWGEDVVPGQVAWDAKGQ